MRKQTSLSSFFLKKAKVQISSSSNAITTSAPTAGHAGDKSLTTENPLNDLDSSKAVTNNADHDETSGMNNITVEMDTSTVSVSDEEEQILSNQDDDYKAGLSEYEKLRLRNIKRNHERLVSLGLIDPSTPLPGSSSMKDEYSQPQRKKRKEAKKINRVNTAPSVPVRRSTRNRATLQENDMNGALDASLKGVECETLSQSLVYLEKEEEMFQDSPLVQYSMEPKSSPLGAYKSFEGPLTSMVPIGPRLSSPQANSALYSLDISSYNTNYPIQWVVGAGKSGIVSIWNCGDQSSNNEGIDPIISWKSHGGRWIADATFVPSRGDLNSDGSLNSQFIGCPSKLLTAANDGNVCLWDLRSSSCSTGTPKNISTTGKLLHKSGIFSMHIDSHGSNYDDLCICTGSKDKTLAVTKLTSIALGPKCSPFFVSHHHTSKVACVQLQGRGSALVGSASDDGSVAIHDYRMNQVVANIDYAHIKPHSVVWGPCDEFSFITAGYDDTIHRWDLRNISTPIESYCGHVPLTTKKYRRIHRPCFLSTPNSSHQYILSGSENSSCLSIFEVGSSTGESTKSKQVPVFSRGILPRDCGDVGCIVSTRCNAAIAVDGGDVLLIEPKVQ
jgi:hypothetical protein